MILAIQTDEIERYVGGEAIRDPGLQEAACSGLERRYYSTLIDEVAVLWESLSQIPLLSMVTSELLLRRSMYL
jgi:death on curing protein